MLITLIIIKNYARLRVEIAAQFFFKSARSGYLPRCLQIIPKKCWL